MRIGIYWASWTGYMDACARALADEGCAEVDIVHWGAQDNALFDESRFFSYARSVRELQDLPPDATENPPDVAIICGWHIPAYRRLAAALRGRSVRIMCMDNQWRGTMRQWLGVAAFRLHLGGLFDYAFVPGPRQADFARRLGFGERVSLGHLSCDDRIFRPIAELPRPADASRTILFVGRLVDAKGIEQLADAWRRFQAAGHGDWTLLVAGDGPLRAHLAAVSGTELAGFVQPDEIGTVMTRARALVLPSRYEPWGVILQEAATAGMAVLATRECGATDVFLEPGENGILIPSCTSDDILAALQVYAAIGDDERAAMGGGARFSG